jgi:hypothetical protein
VRLGVNVPNFGPGTSPDTLARWAQTVEGLGDAWHPLRFTPGRLTRAVDRLEAAADQQRPRPALMLRMALQLTCDLERLRLLGAGTVVLDPFNGDPRETARPQEAWHALAAVADRWARQQSHNLDTERSCSDT